MLPVRFRGVYARFPAHAGMLRKNCSNSAPSSESCSFAPRAGFAVRSAPVRSRRVGRVWAFAVGGRRAHGASIVLKVNDKRRCRSR